jgi:hypothetical protein
MDPADSGRMPLMLNLRPNSKVRISAAGQGAAIGRVEDIRPPAEIPDLAGFSDRGEFAPRQIMLEWGVTRVAMISYHANGEQELMFAALEVDGEWYDLERQHLTLEVVGQEGM